MKITDVALSRSAKLRQAIAHFKDDEVYTPNELSKATGITRNHIEEVMQVMPQQVSRLLVGKKVYYGTLKAINTLRRRVGDETRTSSSCSK